MKSYIQFLRETVGSRLMLCPSVAAVIHNQNGQLLLQEKASGEGWSLPAGTIEPGETPQEAMAREVLEETGFPVSVGKVLDVFGGKNFRYTYPNGDEVEYVVTLFRCQVIGPQKKIADAETKSIRYFSEADMPRLALPYPNNMLFERNC